MIASITVSQFSSDSGVSRAGIRIDGGYPNCRFGVTARQNISTFDTAALNIGWYVDWGISAVPVEPGNIEYVQMVRVRQDGTSGWDFRAEQSWSTISTAIANNPGSIWLIGNEPDSPFQDDMVAESYAQAYYDLYHFIKDQDPTARLGISGVVQPTLLRFTYLDTVWDSYYQAFGVTMPVDIWNIHSFILREKASGISTLSSYARRLLERYLIQILVGRTPSRTGARIFLLVKRLNMVSFIASVIKMTSLSFGKESGNSGSGWPTKGSVTSR
jgi:hypothetical protein